MNKALLLVGAAGVGLVAFGVSKAKASESPGPVFDVTASSGVGYQVAFVKAFDTEGGKQSFWDIFRDGNRIIRYVQLEDDTNSRIFIVSPLDMNDSRVDQALRDFGVRFEGGPVVTLTSDEVVAVRPGQMLVSPGEWLATVDVGFPKSVVVSKQLIKSALEEQGWKQVAVFDVLPKFWPISEKGNYFIQAVWDGQAKIFNVPSEVVDVRSRSLV